MESVKSVKVEAVVGNTTYTAVKFLESGLVHLYSRAYNHTSKEEEEYDVWLPLAVLYKFSSVLFDSEYMELV